VANKLDDLWRRCLNPPEWTKTEVLEFPGSVDGPWARYIDPASVRPIVGRLFKSSDRGRPHPRALPKGEGPGVGTVRWPRIVPKDANSAESLKRRTLTNRYNPAFFGRRRCV
jgi:hypothetical protein